MLSPFSSIPGLSSRAFGALFSTIVLATSLLTIEVKAQTSTPPAVAAATLRVSALRQPIYGFGGSQTFNGDALADFPGRDLVYKALFQELKLDIFRVRNYHDYTGQQEKFERITRDFTLGALKWGSAANRGDKAPVRLMFTSWSPPAYLKSNDLVSGRSDGTDKGLANVTLKRNAAGQYMYGEFASWWLASLRKFRDLSGVYPDYITLQNELDWPVAYEGMEMLPSEGVGKDGFAFAGYDKAVIAVSDKLRQELGTAAPKMLGPETFSILMENDKSRVQRWLDPTTPSGKAALERLFGVAFHIYGVEAESNNHARFHAALESLKKTFQPAENRKPLFQTEFLEGDTLTSFGEIVHDTLAIGEASAYFAWMSARSAQLPGYALVFFRPEDGSIERRERFFAMKHFSAFVGEGWNRVETQSSDNGVLVSAYLRARNRELVAVLVNPSNEEKRITLNPEGNFYQNAVTSVFRSTQGDGGERWRELGALPVNNIVTLPKKSMATVRFVPAS